MGKRSLPGFGEFWQRCSQAHSMGLGVIVGSEMDMYLGWALVEVSGIDVEDLAPRHGGISPGEVACKS